VGLTTRIIARLRAELTGAGDLVTPVAPLDVTAAINLASGTGANQADMMWSDTRTVAASDDEDLDLAGSLTGPLGGTLTFAKIKAVYIKAADGNTNNVNLTRPSSNGAPLFLAAGDGIAIPPGGVFLWVAPGAGVTVTGSTGDLLNIANSSSGSSVDYDVIVIGASA
jgi:hypothetical protein